MALSEEMYDDAPELPEKLEAILVFAINEARNTLMEEGGFAPFVCTLVSEDKVLIETQAGENEDEVYASAQKTVEAVKNAQAYAFCYDGYVDVEDGEQRDAIIAEGGLPGDAAGCAVCCLYTVEGDTISIEDEIVFIGDAPNFMESVEVVEGYESDADDAGEVAEGEAADGEAADAENAGEGAKEE
jgi:hypothetical protein